MLITIFLQYFFENTFVVHALDSQRIVLGEEKKERNLVGFFFLQKTRGEI